MSLGHALRRSVQLGDEAMVNLLCSMDVLQKPRKKEEEGIDSVKGKEEVASRR